MTLLPTPGTHPHYMKGNLNVQAFRPGIKYFGAEGGPEAA